MVSEPKAQRAEEHRPSAPAVKPNAFQAQRLAGGCEDSVLAFLARRPAHTVVMAGLIHANGLESSLNRGTFYGYRNQQGTLEGVGLLGHAVMFETHSAAALGALAVESRNCVDVALIRGEQEKIAHFWAQCARGASDVRRACDEHLLELRAPGAETGAAEELRPATPDELATVMEINSEMALAERGVDPMKTDRVGFRTRTLRRIAQAQVWVGVRGEKIIFKADVLASTPQAIYLEGVYVIPAERGRGCGLRCVRQLSRILLRRAPLICLFVNEDNTAGQALYKKAGFQPAGRYQTIYLRGKSPQEDPH